MNNKWIIGILVVILAIVAIITIGFNVVNSKSSHLDDALIVNGDKISLEEVRLAYVAYDPGQPFLSKNQILSEVVDQLVNYELLVQEAKRRGLSVEPEEIENVISNTLKVNGISDDAKEAYFKGMQTDLPALRKKIANDILVNKLVLLVFNNSEVTQQEISDVYQKNINQLMVPEYVSVRQIFISNSSHSHEEFVNITNEAIELLKTEDFCVVSERYNDAPDNCTVYDISKGTLFPEYEAAAFSQAIGAASLVQSAQGNHIVQTVNKLNFNPVPLSDINQTLANTLRNAKRRSSYVQLIKGLRENAEIVNNLQ